MNVPKFGKKKQEKNPKIIKKVNPVEDTKAELVGDTIKKVQVPSQHSYNSNIDAKTIQKPFFYKPVKEKKLTILLIEDTLTLAKHKENLIKIIKSLVTEGYVSIINYGAFVNQSEIVDFFNINSIISLYNVGTEACLYDALVELENLVSKKYMITEEKETEKIRINKIEVIGIGTCIDNCSKTSKEVGIDVFCKVLSKTGVVTKYFCLTEESFINAAEIGFRSIGAILRNY